MFFSNIVSDDLGRGQLPFLPHSIILPISVSAQKHRRQFQHSKRYSIKDNNVIMLFISENSLI
jgi:hypothetical protein